MQKENILKDPYYQKYMNKENKKRNIRLIILSIFLLALIAVAISLPFILPRDIIEVDNIIYEYYDPNYSYGQNNNVYSFFDAPKYDPNNPGNPTFHSAYYMNMIDPSKYPEIPDEPKFSLWDSGLQTIDNKIYTYGGGVGSYDIGYYYPTRNAFTNMFNLKSGIMDNRTYYSSFVVKGINKDEFNSKSLTIPAEINGYSVTGIGYNALSNLELDSLTFNSNLMTLFPNAINNCEIETLSFSENSYHEGILMFPLAVNQCNIEEMLMYNGDSYILLNQAIANSRIYRLIYTSHFWSSYEFPLDTPYYNCVINQIISTINLYIVHNNLYYSAEYIDSIGAYIPLYACTSSDNDVHTDNLTKPKEFLLYPLNLRKLIVYNNEIESFILQNNFLSELDKLYVFDNSYFIENGTIYYKYDDNINLKYGEIPLDCEIIYMT